jgi:hypothetical protein
MGGGREPGRERERTAGDKTQRGVLIASVLLLIGAMVVSTLLASSVSGVANVSAAGVGVTAALLFFAAAAAGAAVGFLFGLPRTRFIDQVEPPPPGQSPDDPDARPATSGPTGTYYLANSNLIKVSDWLTTIIIGLGLVNLTRIGPAVARLQTGLTEPLGGSASAGVIGVSIVTVGLLAGFLIVYLWTTIRVRELLEDSELQRERVPTLQGRSLREARAMMASAGLRLEEPVGIVEEDLITTQVPEPGTSLAVGEAVEIADFAQLPAVRSETAPP